MTLAIFCAIMNIINAATSFALGSFILLQNPRSRLHQLWGWMSLAIAIWGLGLTACFSLVGHYELALFFLRVADGVAIFIPLFYLHFIIVFLQRNDQRHVLTICYTLSILLACFSFHPLYIPGLKTKLGIQNFNDAGPLFWLFFALYILEPLYAIKLLWQARSTSSGTRKTHITYVLAVGLFGFLVGATWFPLCFNIPLFPIGGCFVWLYCLVVAWAVFKHNLFDIQLVIRKSLIYSLLITLLTIGYFGIIYGIERLFQNTLGYRSLGISLTAFAIMAVVFQPLKKSIQQLVDWLVFRSTQEELARRMELLEQQALQN